MIIINYFVLIYFVIIKFIKSKSTPVDCEYSMSDGSKYNFAKLRKENGDYEYSFTRYIYKANFCGPLNSKCVTSPNTPAALFMRGKDQFILGNSCITRYSPEWKPTVSYLDSLIKTQGLKMIFPAGERCYLGHGNYQLVYLLKCDPNHELMFDTVRKISNCEIEFNFFTKYSCLHFSYKSSFSIFSSTGESSITPKGILITMIIVFSIYLTVFSFLNYRKNPEDGLIKSLPHRSFWSSILENALHGCDVTINFFRSKITGSNEY